MKQQGTESNLCFTPAKFRLAKCIITKRFQSCTSQTSLSSWSPSWSDEFYLLSTSFFSVRHQLSDSPLQVSDLATLEEWTFWGCPMVPVFLAKCHLTTPSILSIHTFSFQKKKPNSFLYQNWVYLNYQLMLTCENRIIRL